MLENIRNFLKKIVTKKKYKKLLYTSISSKRTLVGEEIYYEEYAISAVKEEIKRNIDSFIDINKNTNKDGSITITAKIDIYGK